MQNFPSWTKFGIAVIVQVLLLGGLIFMHQIVLIGGQSVTLKVEPVDPRSPLRGDYVRLQYNISEIDSEKVGGYYDKSETAYVVLEPQPSQDYWEVNRVYAEWPNDVSQNQVVIRGIVKNSRPDPLPLHSDRDPLHPPETSERSENVKLVSKSNSLHSIAQYVSPERPIYVPGLELSYGIEEYYIPEGTGRNVNFVDKDVRAKVKVGSRGRAVLQQIFVDGEPWP